MINCFARISEKTEGVHLGVADKFLLRKHIESLIDNGINDAIGILASCRKYLISLGYNSKEIINTDEKSKESDKKITNYLLKRYNIFSLVRNYPGD